MDWTSSGTPLNESIVFLVIFVNSSKKLLLLTRLNSPIFNCTRLLRKNTGKFSVMQDSYFIHNFDPIILHIYGPIAIRWYGIAYAISFILGYHLFVRINNKHHVMPPHLVQSFITYIVIGVILGGRIGDILFYQTHKITDIFHILSIWQGGMSFHGGLLGVTLSIYIFARIYKINFLAISDIISICAPIGLFFGRIANFINGELYGIYTTMPWGVIFPYIDSYPRHPTQLYEACSEGILLFCIMVYAMRHISWLPKGIISSIFLILYSICRIWIEQFKEANVVIASITMGQFYQYQ